MTLAMSSAFIERAATARPPAVFDLVREILTQKTLAGGARRLNKNLKPEGSKRVYDERAKQDL
jgi:hypothetical protein